MKFAIAVIQQAPVAINTARANPACTRQSGGEREPHSQSAEQVLAAASALGIDRTRYAHYAAMRWGPDWASRVDCCREALDQIRRYCHDPEGLIDKIEVELRAVECAEVARP